MPKPLPLPSDNANRSRVLRLSRALIVALVAIFLGGFMGIGPEAV